jgi:AcrR family transcriptional regulator
MSPVKSRREMYSEATRAALLEEATALFAERGYAGTSLEDVASASQVTRGAVYHHFAGKQALFEAVLDLQEVRATAEVVAAAAAAGAGDPWEAAMLALDAFLDQCCDPTYGRLVWREGPAALGWHRWRECEEKYAYGMSSALSRTSSGPVTFPARRSTARCGSPSGCSAVPGSPSPRPPMRTSRGCGRNGVTSFAAR